MEQRITTSLQQKWLSKLLGFDYTVVYKKGKENLVADALSRLHEDSELSALTHYEKPLWKEELIASQASDPNAQQVITALLVDSQSTPGYTLMDDILKKGEQYYVGNSTELRQKICETIHGSPEGGHSGITMSIKRVEKYFYWPSLKADFTTHIKECETC